MATQRPRVEGPSVPDLVLLAVLCCPFYGATPSPPQALEAAGSRSGVTDSVLWIPVTEIILD